MRLNTSANVDAIFNKLDATKKVSRNSVTTDDVKDFLNTIDAINALPEDETQFNGRLLDRWNVPNSLNPLFYPAAVRMDVTTKLASDVLVRSTVTGKTLDYPKFREMLDKIAALYKSSAAEGHPISDLRKVVTIGDCVKQLAKVQKQKGKANEYYVHWDGESYFLPLQLNVELGFKDAYFNATVQDVLDELILHTADLFKME